MLDRLIEWSARNVFLVLLATLGVVGGGVYAVKKTPLDALPDLSDTQVIVFTPYQGQAPRVVEDQVTYPLTTAMLAVPKAKVVRGFSMFGASYVYVIFEDGTDIYWARQQVAERLSNVMPDLPASISGGLAPISTPLSDIYMFTIEGPLSLQEKRELLDWTIRPALRTVPGVADVNALGGFVRTFEVRPDPVALAAAGLSIADIQAAIESGNRNDGAGRLKSGEEALIVRAVGAIRSVEDLHQLVIVSRGDRIVRLGELATVGIGSLTRYGAVSKNGQAEAVQGLVIALRGADARQVVDGVRARLAEIESTLPAGTHVDVFYDRSDLIARAVGTVEKALLEAAVLVVVLLILFLGDWRAAAIVAATLPMAALITFLFMQGMGLSANLMSLGGL
ncbi:MAG: efflux RND transporter permease subunit, partial [Rhodocyclaceae bacterium]|nr:efflux RND transporter permease subunit [Rhodocyclaceae bacterium]